MSDDQYGGTIEKCSNFGNINSTNIEYQFGGAETGGIIGEAKDTIVRECKNEGKITGSEKAVGGIIGNSDYGMLVEKCYNTGEVEGEYYVGGIAGQNHTSTVSEKESLISQCYNGSSIKGEHTVGGIVGFNGSKIEKSYNIGIIQGQSYIGGIVEDNYVLLYKATEDGEQAIGSTNNSYYLNNCIQGTQKEIIGVFSKQEETMKTSDFVDLLNLEQEEIIWIKGDSNYPYPMLIMQENNEEIKIIITSEQYEISEKNINKIKTETTVENFIKDLSIANATEIKVLDKNSEEVGSDKIIGTGMSLVLKSSSETKTLKLVVSGDVTGDGLADFKDIVAINRHRLNKKLLEGAYLTAGEVTGDETVDFKDIVKINRFRLNKITELF